MERTVFIQTSSSSSSSGSGWFVGGLVLVNVFFDDSGDNFRLYSKVGICVKCKIEIYGGV